MKTRKEDVWVVRMVLLLAVVLLFQPAVVCAMQEEAASTAPVSPQPEQGIDWAKASWRTGLFVGTFAVMITSFAMIPLYLVVGVILIIFRDAAIRILLGSVLDSFLFLLYPHVRTVIFACATLVGIASWFVSGWVYDRFIEKKPATEGKTDSKVRTAGLLPLLEGIGS